ncbi:hypothetical protein D1007_48969 [Hordeum vulgare]|nr:hypothetical protein D1007_48969 [Hordeum vulgare]
MQFNGPTFVLPPTVPEMRYPTFIVVELSVRVWSFSRWRTARLVAHFTNMFDAYYLLGKVFCCGCEFIAFTTYNIFTDFESIFPAANCMHSLPYYLSENDREEEG